jgi:hypothetical protein
LVKRTLPALRLKGIESCHIIINSHGAIAQKDLQDTAVLSTVELISNSGVRITQISALICHAMNNETRQDAQKRLEANFRTTDHMTSSQMQRAIKSSTISILKAKLDKMITSIPQSFNIYGPDRAYLPIKDKELVVKILKGEKGVPYQEIRTKVENVGVPAYKDAIREATNYIANFNRQEHTVAQSKQYDKCTNFLGKVLKKLYTKLTDEIAQHALISPENQFLYKSLKAHGRTEMSPPITEITQENISSIYKDWTKKFRVYHDNRLAVFRKYIELDNDLISPLNSRDNTPLSSPILDQNSSPVSVASQSLFEPIKLEQAFAEVTRDESESNPAPTQVPK